MTDLDMTKWPDFAAADARVDARGHRCPMPLLMAKRGLNTLQPGQTLTLVSTDPGSRRDVEVFTRQSGHLLMLTDESDGELRFLLKKSA